MQHRVSVDILCDTGAGGGSYVSATLWSSLCEHAGLDNRLNKRGRGFLRAANPHDSEVAPMRVLGSTVIPIVFLPDDYIHPIPVRVVHALPYGFILGARFFRTNRSVLDFEHLRGFKPTPSSQWVPFLRNSGRTQPKERSYWTRFCALTADEESGYTGCEDNPTTPKGEWLPPSPELVAFEDDMTLQWSVKLLPNSGKRVDLDAVQELAVKVPGFVSRSVPGVVTGPRPQGKQLVLLLPTDDYDLDKDALVGVARGVQWWVPGTPVSCRVVNKSKSPGAVPTNRVVARLVAMNTRDTARFNSLLHQGPSTTDLPGPRQASHVEQPSAEEADGGPPTAVRVEDANYGQLGLHQKRELEQLLQHFIDQGLFPNDPKRVPACVGGELQLPLIDENCTPVAERQRTFTPEEVDMIRREVEKLTERGIIRPSNSQWAAQVVCVRKSDGTLRLCVDWRKLNALLKTDSGGLGDIQRIFSNLKGKKYFTQMDLASGFHQITIAEKDRPKTAFRDADGQIA